MKTYFTLAICLLVNLSLSAQSNIQQSLSVNSSGAAADPSAQLDVSATDKGMLVPRMTSAQRTAIASPATGLLVFDTDSGSFWFYNSGSWTNLSAAPKTLADADADTKIQVEESPDEDIIRFDLGGTENMVLRKNAGGSPRLELRNTLSNTFVGENAGQSATTGDNNSAFGKGALSSATTGSNNSAFGLYALSSNTGGGNNVALGFESLLNNTTGAANTAAGFRSMVSNTSGLLNAAFGINALAANTAGGSNAALGASSLAVNTSGFYNAAVGAGALSANTTGNFNTATGNGTLLSNTTGSYNLAQGAAALSSNTTGYSNVAVGTNALYNNTVKSNLVAVGDSALFNNGVGATLPFHSFGNTALGSKALFSNTIGDNNTASGHQALFSNTSGFLNTANGYLALQANQTGFANTASGARALLSNTTGHTNTATGNLALTSNTSGNSNTGIGVEALKSNTTGNNNTAVGLDALVLNTVGNNNTAAGYAALHDNKANSRSTAFGYGAMWHADDRTTGRETFNTAIGYEALFGSTTAANNTGQYNTAVGDQALLSNTSGSSNTATGNQALSTNITGNNNTAIGRGADVTADNLSNATAIGYNAKVGADNSLVLGGTGVDAVSVGIGTPTPTARFDISGTGSGSFSGFGAMSVINSPDPFTWTQIFRSANGLSNFGFYNFDNGNVMHLSSYLVDPILAFYGDAGTVGVGGGNPSNDYRMYINGNAGVPTGASFYVGGVTNIGEDGLRMHQTASGSYIDHKGAGDLLFRVDNVFGGTPRMIIQNNGNVGIGRSPVTNILEVEGDASKFSAGDWLANSDARLKKNITPLNSEEILEKLLSLQGITYQWDDDKTGSKRPEGIQYGFTAQNIQQVFPTLVEEDKLGYLQTAYGTYDAMMVEAMRALKKEIENLKSELHASKMEIDKLGKMEMENAALKAQLDHITAALAGAGIAVEK